MHAILSLLLTAAAWAQDQAHEQLTIGSPAPALDIAHWMKGEEVTSFAPGQVYVLEFWATWCAPCVANMEHLSRVQEQFGSRGVHVIGLSDEPLQTTVKFLCQRYGKEQLSQFDRTRYALATDPDRSVHRAYFEAAGLRGIPAVFLIGKDAKIEWIGHPQQLDLVLAAVVEDRWDRAARGAEVMAQREATREFREARDRYEAAMQEERWQDALVALDVLVRTTDDGDLYVPVAAGLLLGRLKDYERGYAYVRQVSKEHWDDNSWLLYQMAWLTSGRKDLPVDPNHLDLDLALRYAERAVELDPWDYHLTMLAEIRSKRGEFAEAVKAQERAIAVLEAKRPMIQPVEMESFEGELRSMRATLADYRAKLR